MKTWDLTAGAGQLEEAIELLQRARANALEQWNDETNRKFQETYLVPLEPRLRRALDAIHRLAQVLDAAERECGSY